MESNSQKSNTRQIRVRRSVHTRTFTEWVVDIPATYDLDEWLTNDFVGFDRHVVRAGRLVDSGIDGTDVDLVEVTQNEGDGGVSGSGTL